MVATISIIVRAVLFAGVVSMAKSAWSVPALGWQSAQSKPSAAEITPMLARKSSTLSSLSVLVVTFLKYCPALALAVGGAWPRVCAAAGSTNENVFHRAASPTTTNVTFHQSFICCPPKESASKKPHDYNG